MSYFQTWVDYRNLKSLHRQIEKRGCLNTSGLGPPQIFEYINKTYGCTYIYIYDMCIYVHIYIYINLFIHFHYSSLNHIPLQTLAALTHRTSHHVHQHFQTVLQPGHSFSLLLSLTVKPLWMRPSCVPGSSKPKQEHPKENGASQNFNGSKFNGFQQNRWMKPWFQAPKRFDEMTTPPLKKKGGTSSHYFPLVNPEIWKVNLRMARMAGRKFQGLPKWKHVEIPQPPIQIP